MKQTIKQGITLQGEGNFISFIFIIAGIVMMFFVATFFFGLALVVILLPVMLSIRGTDIDYSQRTIRKWIWWYGLKNGKKTTIDGYTYAELRNFYSCHSMGCESISGSYTAKTFEIWIGGPNKPRILLTEIPKYSDARNRLDEFCTATGFEKIDTYETMMLRAKSSQQQYTSRRR